MICPRGDRLVPRVTRPVLQLVIFVLAVVAAVVAAPMVKPDTRLREVERFWTARRLTTSWAGPAADGPAAEG